jgi:hypothetical protein
VKTDPETFIRDNTDVMAPPHVPEIRLHLATEAHDLWLKTEEELEAIGLPPPFWAFAWAGGQGLARYVLDHPETVAGRRVLDFASGSGLVAIAARIAGAAEVSAADIDPWSETAIRLNAANNKVQIAFLGDDLVGGPVDVDVVLAGDVFTTGSLPGGWCPGSRLLQRRVSTSWSAIPDAPICRETIWPAVPSTRSPSRGRLKTARSKGRRCGNSSQTETPDQGRMTQTPFSKEQTFPMRATSMILARGLAVDPCWPWPDEWL